VDNRPVGIFRWRETVARSISLPRFCQNTILHEFNLRQFGEKLDGTVERCSGTHQNLKQGIPFTIATDGQDSPSNP
jgi:hypothetical protein